ncbi:MAG: cyclic nucleotide-binding domain-containing protein [Candidatus Hydrogenedentota bacterium]
MLQERIFEENTTLFMEGEESDCAYILKEGRLKVYKNEQLIAELEELDTFVGELGLILNMPRTATVKVARTSRMLVVPAPIENIISSSPGFLQDLVNILFSRLEVTYNRVLKYEEWILEEFIKIFLYELITVESPKFGGNFGKLAEYKDTAKRVILDKMGKDNMEHNYQVLYQFAREQRIYKEFDRSMKKRFPSYKPLDLRTYMPEYSVDFVSIVEGMEYLKIIASKIVELSKRLVSYEGANIQKIESDIIELEEILPYLERENLIMRAFLDKFCYGRIESIREKKRNLDRMLFELRWSNRDKDINKISLIETAQKMGILENYNLHLKRRIAEWQRVSKVI